MAEAPIHYAVLVPREAVGADLPWELIHANGDLASARAAAADWARANLGQTAVVMQARALATAAVAIAETELGVPNG